MSKDKHRSRARRIALLRRAAHVSEGWGVRLGLIIHREGGIAFKNRDLQRLLRDGMVRISRYAGHYEGQKAYAPKRFRSQEPTIYTHCHGSANVTRALITPKGEKFLREHTD